jgi:hypothetical protein
MKTASYQTTLGAVGRCAALAACVVLGVLGRAEGAVITAASLNWSDVSNAVYLAGLGNSNLNTVVVPAGVVSWSNNLLVTNGMTLQFAGAAQSIIYDNIPTVSNENPSYLESIVAFHSDANIAGNTNCLCRLTGLQIAEGTVARPTPWEKGTVQFLGNSQVIRVDDCIFSNLNNDAIEILGGAIGVIDHDTYYQNASNHLQHFLYNEPATWAAGTYGDRSFTNPVVLGTSNALFVETCSFNGPGGGLNSSCIDGASGQRVVFRYNTISNCFIEAHGTESTGQNRGTRSFEIYENFATFPSGYNLFAELRSGTGVAWSNTTVGYSMFMQPVDYRCGTYYQYWGGITGVNPLDTNNPANFSGPVFVTNHIGANASKFLVLGGNVATNYIGYTVVNQNTKLPPTGMVPTNITGSSVTNFGEIVSGTYVASNNTTSFILRAPEYISTEFNTGDPVAFYLPCPGGIDMVGTGLSGYLPRTSAGEPLSFPTNAIEPLYSWGNTCNGVDAGFVPADPIIVTNVHYFNDTPKPGYSPFTYPHPLTLLGMNILPAPTNLRIVP